ncbi:MAG: endonuclease III [Candidatus Omnitrophota bacterium]
MAYKRVKKIIKVLRQAYPNSRVSLNSQNPFQLLVSTILSAQCTDKRTNEVCERLFKKHKNIESFAKVRQRVLEKEIYSTGFYRHKAKNVIAASKKILSTHKGRVPKTMEELTALPGVGRKTANIILSSAFRKAEGIAVDTHVKRLSGRLGLSGQSGPGKIERELLEVVPKSDWLDFNYILVNHGRNTCKARKPLCSDCVIARLCPSKQAR